MKTLKVFDILILAYELSLLCRVRYFEIEFGRYESCLTHKRARQNAKTPDCKCHSEVGERTKKDTLGKINQQSIYSLDTKFALGLRFL